MTLTPSPSWPLHAWSTAWTGINSLYLLGHHEAATLLLGGCEASGLARIDTQNVPAPLATLSTGIGDERLRRLRAVGRTLPLSELIRIGTELPRIRECVALAEQLGNPNGLAYATRVLGSALSCTEPGHARDLLQRSLDLAEPLQLELLIPQSLLELSRVEHTLDVPAAAL